MADQTNILSDKYLADFVHLNEARLYLLKYLRSGTSAKNRPDNNTTELMWGELEGGRCIRLFFPHGEYVVRQMMKDIAPAQLCWFVGFFGTKKIYQDCAEEQYMTRNIEKMDTKLERELTENQPYIVCYISAKRSAEQWYNLVVCTSEEAMSNLMHSKVHDAAVTVWAPLYYSGVHIHSGYLENGLQSGDFTVKKTLCLDYTGYTTSNKTFQRHIESWTEDGKVGVVVSAR